MDIKISVLMLLLLTFIPLAAGQRSVCSHTVTKMQTRRTYVTASALTSYSCGLFYLNTCYSQYYYQQSVYRSYITYHVEERCCDGYSENGDKCSPICSQCAELHLCLAPYMCVCPVDWPGDDCIEPPQNVTVTAIGSDRIAMSWEAPPDTSPSAVLYIVLFQNETHYVDPSTELVMVLDSLNPYTTYNCCVAANTTSGPSQLACTSQTTLKTGAVENLHAVALNDHVLRVSWDPPSSPIGDITEYQLVVTNLVNSAQNVCTIPKDALEKNVSDGIRAYIRYDVCVSVLTEKGLSDAAHIEVYSREGAPSSSPPNITSSRSSATTASVEWAEMSWEDLRGWLVSYEVGYESVRSGQQCPATDSTYNETVSVDREVYGVTGLDPGLQYCVWVAGRTSAGVGPFSHSLIPWSANTVFSVILETDKCPNFIEDKPEETIEDIAREISRGIELLCQCNFPSDHIGDGRLSCNGQELVFQGRIVSTNDRDSSALAFDLEQWMDSEPTVVVRGERLKIVTNDTVSAIEDKTGHFPVSAVVVLVGCLAVIVFLVGFITVAVVCRQKEREKLSKKAALETETVTNTEEESDYYSGYVPATLSPSADGADYEKCSTEQSPTDYETVEEHEYETIQYPQSHPDFMTDEGELYSPAYEEMMLMTPTAEQVEGNEGLYEVLDANREDMYI